MSGLFSMPETPIRLVDGINHIQGTLQTKINNTWYRVCSDGFEENDAIVICRMSGHYHARIKSLGDMYTGALVRIVDGPSPTKGRVEVFYGGHWGPVCRISASSNVASVICRSAGYIYT
ncbi:SRCR1-like protein [Mya arenaria]|uniref:SRCR1-like protein n=1 Tax=Mya arenaria TaxID=6604 RepID=A0ABY7DGZ9_MYAAR|nr:SRCR1-like protein [Mya arenaria]